MSELPEGWVETTLGEVIEIIIDNRGRNPKAYASNGIPVIDNYLIINEKYGYPPDVAKMEADRVLEQSELLASELVTT